jgi:phosphopantetheinyl transferase (holo-ACP synthase)
MEAVNSTSTLISNFSENLEITHSDQFEAFKNLRHNRKKIKVGEFIFKEADIKALLNEPQKVFLEILIGLDENNVVNLYLQSIKRDGGTGSGGGQGVAHSPNGVVAPDPTPGSN